MEVPPPRDPVPDPIDPLELTRPIEPVPPEARIVDVHREPVLRTNERSRGLFMGLGIGGGLLLLMAIAAAALHPWSQGPAQTNVNLGQNRSGGQSDGGPPLSINVNLTNEPSAPLLATLVTPVTPTTVRTPTNPPEPATRVSVPTLAPLEVPTLPPVPTQAPTATRQPPTETPEPSPTATTAPPTPTRTVAVPTPARLPAGFQAVRDTSGSCQYGVPADWQVASSTARAPSGSVSVTLQTQPMSDWTSFVQAAKAVAQNAKVDEDSNTRLWLEQPQGQNGTQHLVAVPGDGTACVMRIDVSQQAASTLIPTVRQIPLTLSALRA